MTTTATLFWQFIFHPWTDVLRTRMAIQRGSLSLMETHNAIISQGYASRYPFLYSYISPGTMFAGSLTKLAQRALVVCLYNELKPYVSAWWYPKVPLWPSIVILSNLE